MVTAGLEPPPGEVSNFENPDKQMYWICVAANAVAIPICTVFMILRLWARQRLQNRIGLDDIACIIGYIGFMGYCAICLLMLRYGGGIHQWNVDADLVPSYEKAIYATLVNYGPTAFMTKAAILLILAKIFSPYQTYVRWIYGFLGGMGIYYLTMLFLKIFICRPISMFWGGTEEGTCFNQTSVILTDNVISLLTDLVILLIPCPLTRTLQVGFKAKVKIAAVFGIGGIACIFSLIRLVFIANEGTSPDQTYVFVKINLTGIAECGIGIVCACFPVMPSLWKSILGKDKTGYSNNSKSNFEMMRSSEMNSRSGNRTRKKDPFEEDSDENDLIHHSNGRVTTNVRTGSAVDADPEKGSNASRHSERKPSFNDARIVRTVEVRQHTEDA